MSANHRKCTHGLSKRSSACVSLRSRRIKGRGEGGKRAERAERQNNVEVRGGGGGGKVTPAIKAPIGSFLRSLAAAKF